MKNFKGLTLAIVLVSAVVISACSSSNANSTKTKNASLVWCYNKTNPIDIDAPNAAGTSWSIRQLANITRDYYESSRNRYSWANNETVINDLYGPSIVQTSNCGTPASPSTEPIKVQTWCIEGSPIDIDAPNAAGTSWSIRQLANITRDYYESSRNRYSWAKNETVINDIYGPSIELVATCTPPTTLSSPQSTPEVAPTSTSSSSSVAPTSSVPEMKITATTQVVNASTNIAQALSQTSNKTSITVPALATEITCAADCVEAALTAAGVSDSGTVYVSINGGQPQKLSSSSVNKIAVGSAKSMVFTVVEKDGKQKVIPVPLDRGDNPASVPAQSENSSSSNSNSTGILLGVIAFIVLVGTVLIIRRKKATA